MSYARTPKSETVRKVTRLTDVTAAGAAEPARKIEAEIKTGADEVSHAVQGRMAESLNTATHAARTMFDFQRDAFESVLRGGKIYAEGLQSLAAHVAHVNRVHMDESMAALRTLTATRSIGEAMRLQAEHARSTTTRAMTETGKLVQDYFTITEKSVAPLTEKIHEATAKFAKAA